jgi:protein SCO1/2
VIAERAVASASRARVTAAAALLVCAAALLPGIVEPVHAHGPAPAARDRHDAAPAVPAVIANRWGASYFPNVELTTQDGVSVRLYDDLLKGKSVAINVVFTECTDACPLETAMLVQLQRLLGERVGKDIFFYSISIDPARDSPEVLKAYAEKFGVGPGWLFLTGKPEDIKLVTRKLGLLRATDRATRDGHSAILMVGNEPTGQWMRNAATDNPNFLAGRIGSFLGWKQPKPEKSYAQARPLEFENGQYVFQSRCSACHSIGGGDRIGPDLLDVTLRRQRAWLARYIGAPDEVLAKGDPIATDLSNKYKVRMPNLHLGDDELADVLSYLHARSRDLRKQQSDKGLTHAH